MVIETFAMRQATVRAYDASGGPSEPQECTDDPGSVLDTLHRMKHPNPKFAIVLDKRGYTIGAAVWFGGDWIVRCGRQGT